ALPEERRVYVALIWPLAQCKFLPSDLSGSVHPWVRWEPSLERVLHHCVVAYFCLLMLAFTPAAVRAQAFQTTAPYAFLIDYDTGTVLLEKNPDTLMSPASTSKLMTAELVF